MLIKVMLMLRVQSPYTLPQIKPHYAQGSWVGLHTALHWLTVADDPKTLCMLEWKKSVGQTKCCHKTYTLCKCRSLTNMKLHLWLLKTGASMAYKSHQHLSQKAEWSPKNVMIQVLKQEQKYSETAQSTKEILHWVIDGATIPPLKTPTHNPEKNHPKQYGSES